MGKITKVLQPKHRESMSPWLAEYVQSATNSPLPLLPRVLEQFPARWPLPRGDMYHWIPLLNRFDNILECFVDTYALRGAPQTRDFASEILLQTTAHPIDFRDSNKWDSVELEKLGFKEDADAQLVLAVLKFTRNLLQHCGNRSIYASSSHLSSLLNSSSLHILKASLHVGHELALRYHASYKRTSSTSRAFHSALLQNHYDISLDRVQQLALPFVKTPISGTSASSGPFGSSAPPTLQRTPSTPAPAAASSSSAAAGATPVPPSTGKGKEKAHGDSPKAATTMYSNDFIAISTSGHAGAATTDTATQGPDWSSWGDIKITYYPQHQSSRQQDGPGTDQQDSSPSQPQSVHDRTGYSSIPSTPTPLRRTSTMGSQTQDRTPRVSGQAVEDASSPLTPAQTRTPGNAAGEESAAPSGQRSFELPSRVVQASTVYELITRCPADMPETARYEVLSRIRIAKALLGDEESRQLALAVRLLAITNLAFIHPEAVFLEQVLKQDAEEPRRFQLAYQLAELIRPGAGKTPVPIWLQSIALQLLESLAGFASKTNDVVTAVNATVNHGVLLYVLRKAVADMKDPKPESNEEMILNDDWRKQLFSLTLHLTAGNRMQDIVGAGLMEILVDALKVRSPVAERNYLVVVTFLDTIVLNFPTSFQPFASAHGLDVVSQLLVDTVASAQEAVQKGEITGREMRCSVIDYDIPFYLQQTLKWLLKFIYHLMASSYQFGPGNDRLLRNLVDNSQLLQSMRTIIEKSTMFGSVVWTNAATTLSHFINHDPTSFAALSESHLIQSFLESITGRPLPPAATPKAPGESTEKGTGEDGGEGGEGEASGADGNGSAAAPSNDQDNDENDEENEDDDDDDDRDTTQSDESLPDKIESSKPPLSPEELARPRDWTLAGGILPSTEVIGSIPSILNSISLNNVGRKMVTTSGALTSYFEIFESPAHVRCMETETGLPSTIGTNFDELARHHPSLRPQITTAVMDMVSRVGYLAEKKAETDAWGLRLLPAPKPTSTATAASATESTSTGTEDVEMADASATAPTAPTAAAADTNLQRPAYQDALSFITATSLFLNVYLSNPTLQSLFIKRGGIETLLDLVESPGLPFIQPSAMISPTLLQIFALLLESSPILAAPAMFSRVNKGLDAIAPLVEPYTKAKVAEAKSNEEEDVTSSNDKGIAVEGKAGNSSVFTIFVEPNSSEVTPEKTAAGTTDLKALFRVRYLLYLIQSCFPLNRQGTTTMYPLVLFDYYKEFIERLGPLLTFSMGQEAALNAAVPDSWSKSHAPALETSRSSTSASAGAAGGSSGADAASDADEPAYAEVLANTAFTQPGTSDEAANSTGAGAGAGEAGNSSSAQPSAPAPPAVDKPTKQEMSSDAYQNYQTMRTLFRSFPSVIVPALQALGKSLLPRRERDAYIRGQHLQLAETLALTILDQLKFLHDVTPATQRHRKFILEALQDLLVDPTRHSERPDGTSTSYVVVPVLLAFKKHGGFEALNALLRFFADTVNNGSRDRSNVSNLYFAAIGMKSILDLYAVIVQLKNIQDSTAQVSIFARPTERQYTNQPANQLMIETWMAVLPVVSELWQSPVLEKISSGVLGRLIEIMKTIGSISLEHGYYTRESRPKTSPTDVFGGPPVPFPWSDNENRISRASERDNFAVDLAVESIYRANGNSEMAQEYGHAIVHGLTRSRLPVPAVDARPTPPDAADPPTEASDNGGEGSSEAAAQASASADGVDVTVAPVDGSSGERANTAPRLPFSMDVMALDNPRSSEDLLIENLLDDDEFALPRIPMPPPPLSPVRPGGSASRSSSSKKDTKDTPDSPVVSDVLCREDVEEKRAGLRKDLIDRCLAVIQMHHDSVQDIAELISASVLQAPDLDDDSHNSAQQEVGETLVEALISFAIDDENKNEHAQSIAAYAYLLCLLINDTVSFFDVTVEILRNNIDELLGFLHVPLGGSPDDLPPWLSHIYLLFEILLIKDEQETPVEWAIPTLDSAEIKDLTYVSRSTILDDSQRGVLLDSTLDLLPRIGKDDGLAVSASRVLQIMTRRHTVAKTVGEKKNLQRLFLMAKQLSGIGAGGFTDTRLNVYVITTLRHIVEDEDVLRQIMTHEIRHFFENSLIQRSSRHHDLQTFLDMFAHVALRNPTLFISVLSDLVKMTRVTNENLQRHNFAISLKESETTGNTDGASKSGAPASHDDSFGPAVQATQELNINDVRPSTETDNNAQAESSADGAAKPAAGTADKDMPDAPAKPTEAAVVEHKRPVVENPDGVITFLLEQLMTYQKVDDAEAPATKDAVKHPLGSDIPITAAPTPDPAGEGGSSPSTPVPFASVASNLERDVAASASASASASAAAGAKDKDKEKAGQVFRSSDHPIFVFRAFLISCLSELLRSYSRSKMEFINFKRGVALQTLTPVKPRTSVLNYLLNDILCAGSSGGQTVPPETVAAKKKAALADQARRLLTALVEKTPEKYVARASNIYEFDEDSDLQFVRRFVLDTILKAYKEAASSSEPIDIRYGKMSALGELMSSMIGADKERSALPYAESHSYMQLRRLMYEKGYLAALTHSIADIDLAFPGAKRTLKHVLRVLNVLTATAIMLSRANIISSTASADTIEYDIMSSSSLSDNEDDREETPDLYRNSSLGMLEGGDHDDEEYSDSEHEDDMYDDEMEYDDEMTDDGEENLSDDDDDEMGPVEGLSGEPGVVELVMDDGDDDDDDDEDDEEDSDDVGSEDMEDMEDQIEEVIEDLNEDEIMDDDGASEWESEEDDDEGDDDDGYDDDGYEVEPAGHLHQVQIIPSDERMSRFDEIVRNLGAAEFGGDDVEIDHYDDPYIEDGVEEEDEDEDDDAMDEEDYIYDQDYPHEDPMADDSAAGLAWETMIADPHRHHHHHGHGHGHPYPMHRHHRFGADFNIFRNERPGGRQNQNVNEGVNPMLRRSRGNPRDGQRPSAMFRLGIPSNIFTNTENPMALLNDLMNNLPALGGGRGQPLHFQITQGPHGELREVSMPMPHDGRMHHHSHGPDSRRDPSANTEPAAAIAFRSATTADRWTSEARMVYGPSITDALRPTIYTRILHALVPAGVEEARKERDRKLELERQEAERKERAEKEQKEREAKEAEERARKQAEEEKAAAEAAAAAAAEAAAAAAEAAVNNDNDSDGDDDARGDRDTSEPMEGVETAADADAEDANEAPAAAAAAEPEQPQERVMAIIRGAEMDITDLGIDPEYLEALPEEFREEVIAQALTARRSEARQQAETAGGELQDENFNAFLDALPDDLRLDIVQQEQQELRRRQREEERRQVGNAAAVDNAAQEEMDTASILMSFPPHLRNEILREQGEELFDRLPPEMAAHARSLLEQDQPVVAHRAPRLREEQGRGHGERANDAAAGGSSGRAGEAAGGSNLVAKFERRPVVQMMDRSGVATLLRLMFVTQLGTTRTCLFNLFIDLCQNRQSRLEIISTLLQILQDGSSDMDAVERCFNQLTAKARQPPKDKEKDAKTGGGGGGAGSSSAVTSTPGTGGSLKRTATSASLAGPVPHTATHLDSSPLLIVQQGLDLLVDLCSRNQHIPSLFLSEHDFVGASLRKPFGSRKAKGIQSKASRFGINSLLLLLEKDLVMESSSVMQLLAELLNRVTQPLQALERERRRRELAEKEKLNKEAEAKDAPEDKDSKDSKDAESGEAATSASAADPGVVVGASSSSAAPPADTTASEAVTATAATTDATNAGEGSASASKPTTAVAASTTEKPVAAKEPELVTPFIPYHNLSLVVNIFVARECSSKTFQNTISTIKNLSCIEGTKQRFGKELARQAKTLSDNILRDLDELLPYIEAAETGTEIQGIALAKFSPGAAEQNKLLRVLTALDHLFGVQAKKTEADSNSTVDEEDYMGSLYHNATFVKMWGRLSSCLSAIRQRDSMLNVATILLPLIESLMVVCKNANLPESTEAASIQQMSQSITLSGKGKDDKDSKDSKQKEKEETDNMLLLSSPPPESRPQYDLFFRFTEDHRRILNELVRNNPKLMSGTFSLLVKNPKVLEFDNKRNYFNRSVHAKTGTQQQRPVFPPLQLSVRRDQVFHDSFRSLYFKSGDEMKYGKLNIRFHGEEGVDAGGVTREWFQVLSRQMFDPNYALFIPVSSDRTTFHPNKLSGINDEHLMFFKFIGRIIGKALYEGRLLECYFSRAVYKRILGKPVSVKDMESFDPEYYKSLVWMLENDITDVITETFSVVDDEFGATKVVDLIPNGRDVAVTEENKHDYVRLVVEHKLLSSVKDQMGEFLMGFHDIIPAELISIFTEQELELLISGLPDIDIDDWRGNTEYHNYSGGAPQIQWFWRAVRSFDKEERAKLLQFVTGTSKVPLNGFKELEGMNGINRFNIHRDYGQKDRLPSSHTCFNQLDLPEYESYDAMRSQLLKAITAGNDYFGFA